MKILLFLVLVSNSWAHIEEVSPKETVKSSTFNHNFSYLKNLLRFKLKDVDFSSFQANQLISNNSLNEEFSKLTTLGLSPGSSLAVA